MSSTDTPAVSARVLSLLDAALAGLPGAVVREGQRDMTVAVDRALRQRTHLLVQAGTGTGKSLAYLVPALASGRRVVVATATKALQAQLVDKDLPRLAAALAPRLGRTPTFALAKGRGNYACLQQLSSGAERPGATSEPPVDQVDLFGDVVTAAPPRPAPVDTGPTSELGRTVLRLRQWAGESASGDRDDVPFPVSDLAWRQVSVSSRDCLGSGCPDRVECFAERAREAAKEADVVVANHALLALDVFSDAAVLPEHDAVILDEAHEFVDAAVDALTHELSAAEVRRAAAAARAYVGAAVLERLEEARAALEAVVPLLPVGWVPEVPPEVADVVGLVGQVAAEAAREVTASGVARSSEDGPDLEGALRDRAKQALLAVVQAAEEVRTPGASTAVHVTPQGVVRVSPLHVAAATHSRLLTQRTLVAASATLTFGGRFDHAAGQLGLTLAPPADGDGPDASPPLRWDALDVGSPFDYPRQAQLWVADRLPPPTDPTWPDAVDDTLVELATAAGGRTLGLFSSTAAAARAAAALRERTDLPVLLQGEDTAGALVRAFASDARTCLMGTRSFWQGVDVPGPACQLVVIDRLPFSHVDDPLQKARLAEAGDAGFRLVTLPPAGVLLAQGVGRLIRADGDRGVVAVLDRRLATAGYAGLLLAGLPPMWRARDREAVLASLRAIDASAPPVVPPVARGRAG